jgi:DNA replication protein DnaC
MTTEETINKLGQLRLPTMAQCYRELIDAPRAEALTFQDGVAILVDREWMERENRRTSRRIKDAKLGMQACMEDVWCDPARGRDKGLIRGLSTCQWVRSKQNVIVTGLTGTGKSYIGAALAEAACRRGYRALRVRAPRLLAELAIAHADGSFPSTLQRLAKLDVLVLDDFLICPMKEGERRDLLEVLEDRYERTSTVITSQVPTKTWHEMLSDPTLADAICDRVVHNAHVLALKGPSIRKMKGLEGNIPEAKTGENKG